MANIEIYRQKQRLDTLFKTMKAACGDDLDLQSHWARYLCILVAGFLENCIKEIYSDFVQKRSYKTIADFAITHLARIQNPKSSKFIETAYSFSKEWGDQLTSFLEDNGRKDAIDSIMQNRHDIAHGKNSGITHTRLSEYYIKALEVIVFLEKQTSTSKLPK